MKSGSFSDLKELKKNDIITLQITSLTSEGSGIGRAENGMVVFVPFTSVGDKLQCRIVKVCKNYCYGKIESLITPSPFRIEADCGVYGKCGGCVYRHISYAAECEAKLKIVTDAFERIAGVSPQCDSIIAADEVDRYRNKAQYPVTQTGGKLACGFYASRSHRVVAIDDCPLQPKVFSEIVKVCLECMEKAHITAYFEESGRGEVRHIYLRRGYNSGEIMLCIVAARDISKKLMQMCQTVVQSFPEVKSIVLNINPKNTNVILGEKCVTLFGSDTITDIMCGNVVELSPLSFYQVNTAQAQRLYAKAFEYASPQSGDVIADLYCGAGTIGLSMAKRAKDVKIIGVEQVAQAVENAKRNAERNGITNATVYCGDAGEVFSRLRESGCAPDVIVVDPPRKGCSELTIETIAKAAPKRIVMVSCDPATAARDVKRLMQYGYTCSRLCAVDMFPRTSHVECVVGLKRT